MKKLRNLLKKLFEIARISNRKMDAFTEGKMSITTSYLKKMTSINTQLIGFVDDHLNEIWKKEKGRLTKQQCINLGAKIDEGWKIHANNIAYIHIIYQPEYKILSIMEICESA